MPGRVALTRMISAVFRRGGDVSFVVDELKAIFDPRGGQWSGGRYVPSLMAAIGEVIEKHMIAIGFIAPRDATAGAARNAAPWRWRRKARRRASARAAARRASCRIEGCDSVPRLRLFALRLSEAVAQCPFVIPNDQGARADPGAERAVRRAAGRRRGGAGAADRQARLCAARLDPHRRAGASSHSLFAPQRLSSAPSGQAAGEVAGAVRALDARFLADPAGALSALASSLRAQRGRISPRGASASATTAC